MNKSALILANVLMLFTSVTFADQIKVDIASTGDPSKSFGQVTFEDSPYGLLIKPNLKQLSAGLHGFHIHQKPSCENRGMSAGGHFDPEETNSHQGPYGKGHLGDLPILYVNQQGAADTTTLAPRLKTTDLKGHTIMIHEGGDTYSDVPPLGGGGARIACGVIP